MKSVETCGAIAAFATLLLSTPSSAQVTQRVSFSWNGGQANGTSFSNAVSADGRYVVFESLGSNIVTGDSNDARDVFVRDRLLGTTERVNVSSSGAQSNGDDFWNIFVAISADGRFATYSTNGSNLVPGDTNQKVDIFLRDRQLGTTERISVSTAGTEGNQDSRESSISADGRYVAFRSYSDNLVAGDTNGYSDVFVRDRLLGTTTLVSVDSAGIQGNSTSQDPAISPDGRYIAFVSYGSNLFSGDTNGMPDIFVRDRQTNTTERVTFAFNGGGIDLPCSSPSISADGRFVAFESYATNLVPGDTNGLPDIYVRDRLNGTTELIDVSTSGVQGNYGSVAQQYPSPGISADGRYVVYSSDSTNLVNGDTNGSWDVFRRDRLLGVTERMSVGSEGEQGNGFSYLPSISANGRYVTFSSVAGTFDANDLNNDFDIYVRDVAPTGFTSLCSPGVDGVITCPCSNPPSGAGRGCDNSSATGGATLTASGIAYLSLDSLRFTTSDERPTALSILTQWTGTSAHGAQFGMGVRCTTGTFKRLYTKVASGGSITVPDLNGGDAHVSVRSAALGDTLHPGDSRWYFVYYRDPVVLGGCSAFRTFNATQTGQVTWWP
jgi:Tol biopolymer transport system component